ncbi:hypothetical protein LSH36_1342g00031 [Paralvinella palmiformis]|uniref:Tyrosine-protein kinase n=1 Tax=Paralvinella palmiformis TaxID=53620 RepID=A0AAD9ITL1_9ANNE|nr:hypothetical protein LSH36_1342g00031 [Paralvinella palmiformis]
MQKKGVFLIRESMNFPGEYTLCVQMVDKIEHYHITYHDNKLTIDKETLFNNLVELIQHYKWKANGLCTNLIQQLENTGRLEYCVSQKEFEQHGWSIAATDIELSDLIGSGDFAGVYKAEYKPTKMTVAVKKLKQESEVTRFLVEAAIMTQLQHPNLVELIGVVVGVSNINIVIEYMANGSLVEYLRTRGRMVITSKNQISFASDTCRGMTYMESKHLIHRDLAARNVLINKEGVAKAGDFPTFHLVLKGARIPIKDARPQVKLIQRNGKCNPFETWYG